MNVELRFVAQTAEEAAKLQAMLAQYVGDANVAVVAAVDPGGPRLSSGVFLIGATLKEVGAELRDAGFPAKVILEASGKELREMCASYLNGDLKPPKKAAAPPEVAVSDDEEDEEEEEAPKRRGRPRKAAAKKEEAPKRRGRPRKKVEEEEAEETEEVEEDEEEEEAPKRRGRPRKAAAKKEEAPKPPTDVEEEEDDEEDEEEEEAPKRRGRPRKAASSAAAPKRRGRPRKVVEEEEDDEDEEEEEESPAPKRRGRPRKKVEEEEEELEIVVPKIREAKIPAEIQSADRMRTVIGAIKRVHDVTEPEEIYGYMLAYSEHVPKIRQHVDAEGSQERMLGRIGNILAAMSPDR